MMYGPRAAQSQAWRVTAMERHTNATTSTTAAAARSASQLFSRFQARGLE